MSRQDDFFDRRAVPRIKVHSSLSLETLEADQGPPIKLDGVLTSLSESGVSLAVGGAMADDRHFKMLVQLENQPHPIQLAGRIKWHRRSKNSPAHEYGIEFLQLAGTSKDALRKFIGDNILNRRLRIERRKASTVASELVKFDNRKGKRIIGFHDRIESSKLPNLWILIPPAYGETKTSSLTVSYYLARNGFNVLRYDATDHEGESDGEMLDCTLEKMREDLAAALDYIERAHNQRKAGVVASSLAARVAVKAAAQDERIKFLVCLVCVANLREGIAAAYHEDMIGASLEGKDWGVRKVLGREVRDEFLKNAIACRYHDLESTREDMKKLSVPVAFFSSKKDIFVKFSDIKSLAVQTKSPLFVLPNTLHQIYENRSMARAVLKRIVLTCLSYEGKENQEIVEPANREIAVQSRAERGRLRNAKEFETAHEKAFWESYLPEFSYILKSGEYRKLLDLIYRATSPVRGKLILDAGCGNGNYALWLLMKYREEEMLEKAVGKNGERRAMQYVGLDYVESALKEARRRLASVETYLMNRYSIEHSPIFPVFVHADLNNEVPFVSGYFDAVCCNLVLSYVKNPLLSLRELARTLKPGSPIAVSSLKPHADLSQVFHDFAAQDGEKDLDKARALLDNAGLIKQKEGEGFFRLFSEPELRRLMGEAGLHHIQTAPCFGGQANIALGKKR